jgi:hypothetical protein
MIITCTHCKEQIFEDYDFCTHCSRNENYYFCSKTCRYEWLLTTDEKTNFKKVEENRQCPRSLINWPVIIKTSKKTIMGETRDLSHRGAFICCGRPIPPNRIFFLSLHIRSSTVSLTSTAETVWSTHNGMGVKFHLDRPEQGELLSNFIANS